MRAENKKTQFFTAGERMTAGLAIVTAIVLALSAQVAQSMMRPSLGLYDASSAVAVALPNVIDASPLARAG